MDSSVSVLMELLERDEALDSRLGDAWPALRDELIALIARMDAESGTVRFRRDVDTFIDKLRRTGAEDVVREALSASTPRGESFSRGRTRAVSEEAAVESPEEEQHCVIPVFFGTDRRAIQSSSGITFGSDRGEGLAYGVAGVSVPVHRKAGDLPLPRWWRLEFRPEIGRHVAILQVRVVDQTSFIGEIADGDVLLIVHGYNVTFDDAVRRAAQVSRDLQFPGRTALFSWPSKGNPLLYLSDVATVETSEPHFQEFLRTILGATNGSVHIIAHSMGNRIVTAVLEDFEQLGQVVFAAPDVDSTRFLQLARAFVGRAKRFTLYASAKDVALRFSTLFARYPRAGYDLTFADGIDTVDATRVDTTLFGLGHSYFGTERSILGDVHDLLILDAPPDKRSNIEPVPNAPRKYWRYRV